MPITNVRERCRFRTAMSLAFLLILAVLLVAWPFLTVLGHERQRQLLGRNPRTQPAPPAGPSPAPPKPTEAPVARDVAR